MIATPVHSFSWIKLDTLSRLQQSLGLAYFYEHRGAKLLCTEHRSVHAARPVVSSWGDVGGGGKYLHKNPTRRCITAYHGKLHKTLASRNALRNAILNTVIILHRESTRRLYSKVVAKTSVVCAALRTGSESRERQSSSRYGWA